MILITGSTGNTGGELHRLLSESGHQTVCMTSREQALQNFRDQGIAAVLGNFDQPESLEKALQGVEMAFLVCTPDEKLQEREIRFIDAAKKVGVRKIVKISALLSGLDASSPNLRMHAEVEAHLKSSGLTYTLLQPNGFMQTFFWMVAPAIQAQGVLPCPAGEGRCAMIDVRDVAKAAWSALVQEGHDNKSYQLTGPESLGMSSVAERVSAAMGRPVQYMDMPEEPLMQQMRDMGVSENSVEHVAVVFRLIKNGALAFTTNTLEQMGITPLTWADCARDLAAGVTETATSFHQPPSPDAS